MIARLAGLRAHRPLFKSAFLVLGLAAVTTCGGGGGGGSDAYVVNLSTPAVHFTAREYDPLPATQTVHATYTGDGMVVGFPQGSPIPGWLAVDAVQGAGKSVDVHLQPSTTFMSHPGPPPYEYTSAFRFVTGKSDMTHLTTVDLPVTYTVTKGLVITTTPINAVASQGSSALGSPFDLGLLASEGCTWTITTDQPWMGPSMSSGSGSPVGVNLTVSAANLTPGTYQGTVTVQTTDGTIVRTLVVHLTVS
ncbi:MAG TPA: hypothetical protein VJ623_13235 [Holophagaceae bacterium]|nr:hypothetical protein [Holophagaceae bacterium]